MVNLKKTYREWWRIIAMGARKTIRNRTIRKYLIFWSGSQAKQTSSITERWMKPICLQMLLQQYQPQSYQNWLSGNRSIGERVVVVVVLSARCCGPVLRWHWQGKLILGGNEEWVDAPWYEWERLSRDPEFHCRPERFNGTKGILNSVDCSELPCCSYMDAWQRRLV